MHRAQRPAGRNARRYSAAIERDRAVARARGHRDAVWVCPNRRAGPESPSWFGHSAVEWRLARPLGRADARRRRSEEHTSELQSLTNLVCRLLLEKKKREEN